MKFFKRHIRRLSRRQKIILFFALIFLVFLFFFAIFLGPFRSFFWDTPSLAGFPFPKRYLVMLQNNNEIRPSGGFLSGYGTVRMTFGIPSVDFSDSYSISTSEYVTPPYPFEKLIGDDPFYTGWQFRDANFSPDFETSAKQVLAFYNMQYPKERFHGVVALDFNVVEDILRVLGGVEVEGDTVTADNFFILVQRRSKDIDTHSEEALEGRKGFLPLFANVLAKRIIFSPFKYSAVMNVLEKNLNEKHVLLFSEIERLQNKYEAKGWSGAVDANVGDDFLHINIANIGGRKADRYVDKRYEYRVRFRNDGPVQAQIRQTFTHYGDYNLQSDRYQAYIRTYVPLGSRLTRSKTDAIDQVQFGEELGAQYYGNTIVMMPGERRELLYEYDLPENIVADDYVLQLMKQAGASGDDYSVVIQMPNDSSFIFDESDAPFDVKENIGFWQGKLYGDLTLRAQKQGDTFAPIIQWQEFRNLRTIEIRFNELLNPEIASDISRYLVFDKNYADERSDNIRVDYAWLDGMDLLLQVSGISNTPGERYGVRMSGVEDLSGNVIEPNPKEVTVVRR
jgi:hypothetical protein